MAEHKTQLCILGIKVNGRYYVYQNNAGHAAKGELLINDLPTGVNYVIVYPMGTHATYNYTLDKNTELVYLTVEVKSNNDNEYNELLNKISKMKENSCDTWGLYNIKVSLVEETPDRYHWLAENAVKLGLQKVVSSGWNEVFIFDYPKTGANNFEDIKKLYQIFSYEGYPKISIDFGNIKDYNQIAVLPDVKIGELRVQAYNASDKVKKILSQVVPTYVGLEFLLTDVFSNLTADRIPTSYYSKIIKLKGDIWWAGFVINHLSSHNSSFSDYEADGPLYVRYRFDKAKAVNGYSNYIESMKDPAYEPVTEDTVYEYGFASETTDDREDFVHDILEIDTPVLTPKEFKELSYLWKDFSKGAKDVLERMLVMKDAEE